MSERSTHSYEAMRLGKPDQLEASLAHLVGAELLRVDGNSRFDVRVHGSYSPADRRYRVMVSGEISDLFFSGGVVKGEVRERLARVIVGHYNKVCQTQLYPDEMDIELRPRPQSPHLVVNGYAGDSGNPIALAYSSLPNRMPLERFVAHELRLLFDDIYARQGVVANSSIARASGIEKLEGLGADGKIGVSAQYFGAHFRHLLRITLALQHEHSLSLMDLRSKATALVNAYIAKLQDENDIPITNPQVIVNGAGDFHIGGWQADEGNREAKPQTAFFGSHGVNEDSPWGEDPTKPSGTGTILARNIAVNVVASRRADYAKVSLDYAIGDITPLVAVETLGTGNQGEIEEWVHRNLPLNLDKTVSTFHLRDPELYRRVALAGDFFHDPTLPWNIPNKDE